MKTILILSFIALAMSGFVTENEDLYNYLKENAPYEIYEPEENPFRDLTEEQIYDMFNYILDYPY